MNRIWFAGSLMLAASLYGCKDSNFIGIESESIKFPDRFSRKNQTEDSIRFTYRGTPLEENIYANVYIDKKGIEALDLKSMFYKTGETEFGGVRVEVYRNSDRDYGSMVTYVLVCSGLLVTFMSQSEVALDRLLLEILDEGLVCDRKNG